MTSSAFERVSPTAAASLLSAPADGHHLVHFYEDEAFLFDVVGQFLGAGLEAGERLVVIATPEHRSGFVERLRHREVDRAIADGRLLLLDARETLAAFMVNDRPDAARFHRVLEEALMRVAGGRTDVRIRAYGEMVDLLWRDGQRSAAIALEELWNEASTRHAFSLLCAYVMANFYKGGDGASFADVCRTHSHVLPPESVANLNGASMVDADVEISRLAQRLRSAELEIERLREIEKALRESSSEQRRRADEALLASEARFHQLIDAVTDYAIFLLDADGHVVTWNPGARKIKGYAPEEILGQHFAVFYTPEDRAAGKPAKILESLRREGRFEDESWRVRKDGSRFWANVVITTLRDQEGNITGFAKVTRDLTARRHGEERERELAREQAARAASEKTAREIERLNRVGALFIADESSLDAVLHEIVDVAIAIAGADFGNIQLLAPDGAKLKIVAHRGFSPWWLDFWNEEAAGRGGAALERRERVIVEDVEQSPLFVGTPSLDVQRRAGVRAVASIPIVSRAGQLLGMCSTHYRSPHRPDDRTLQMLDVLARQTADIIDRARADEAERSIRRELEQANRAKDEFVATMSHELRTPLNAVLGWATLLRKSHSDPASVERGLEVIERNARAQSRLVSDLLDVSRIISGKLRLAMKRTAPNAAICAAADVVRPAAEAKRVRLVLDLDPDVGTTLADPDRLQQIVWNVLSNAVRFTPEGGRVTVTAQREGSVVSIRVQDTGAGIAPEHLPHIFERFRQVDSSTTRKHGGLGLGLAIVRHLVEAHGGSVSAASEGLGTGATFTIHLPIPAVNVLETDASTDAKAYAGSAAATPAVHLKGVRALVVDDDLDSLELLRIVLEGAGAAVTAVRDAQEALAAPGPFDVILSDIGMPEIDGYDLMRRIRSRSDGANTPAIAITAFARPEDADRAARAGYQEHLAKPVDASALLEAVVRWTRWKAC